MEWLPLALEVATTLARAVIAAIQAGDASILDKPVRELLGQALATTLAKRAADARAAAKFGDGAAPVALPAPLVHASDLAVLRPLRASAGLSREERAALERVLSAVERAP